MPQPDGGGWAFAWYGSSGHVRLARPGCKADCGALSFNARGAADDLAAIFLDGLEQCGLLQADAYHEGLGVVFAFLADYPHAARLREDILPPVRR
ncbi:hypothetical protein J2792_004164 [Novosphingobium capsulatum]|uniref:Uncharacterized protein n=1 Tax=Novosphingobium capsulatum TaxID=13688 RepID=A0ABU1MSF9_9SPHN|nr:hypothetical protein [Novosphingobium capsulatum]